MQTNAIQRTVEQFENVQLIPRAALAPGRKPKPKYAKGHVLRQGPLVLDYMAQGLTQTEIAEMMGITLTSVQAYASQYRRAVREGLV